MNQRIISTFDGQDIWYVGYGRNVWIGIMTDTGWVHPKMPVSVAPSFWAALSALGGMVFMRHNVLCIVSVAAKVLKTSIETAERYYARQCTCKGEGDA